MKYDELVKRRVEHKNCATVYIQKFQWEALTEEQQQAFVTYEKAPYIAQGYEHFAVMVEADELFDEGGNTLVYTENLKVAPHVEFARNHVNQHLLSPNTAVSQTYAERDILVRLLCRYAIRAGTKVDKSAPQGWQGAVYLELPGVGQCSWHYPDSEAELFADLPAYEGEYNGHSTLDKYERLIVAARSR